VKQDDILVTLLWHATPWRGDKFEEIWRPAAAAALDYGASWWAFLRSMEDPLDFTQMAVFQSKHAFERYWFAEEIADARATASGYFAVPILPIFHRVTGVGEIEPSAMR
jgi:hypothetical protein